jgi:hypothetical protein
MFTAAPLAKCLPKPEFARLDFGDIGLKEKPLGEEGLF